MPSRDAQWVIGTIVVVGIALSVQLAGARAERAEMRADMRSMEEGLRADMAEMRADMQRMEEQLRAEMAELRAEMRADMAELRADVRSMDTRLRAVEVAFGKVDQRLLTLERVILPARPADDPTPAPTPPGG